MAKRRNEGLLDVLAGLPWPAGVAFGVIGFSILYGAMLKPFAWMALLIGLLTAAMSALRALQRARLLDQQTGLASLRAMSWRQFEQLVGEAYRRLGYSIEETGQGGADGGIDLLLRKGGVTTLVQCKQWRNQKIGVAVVREMYGLMVHHDAYAVKIVCTGVFSSECEAFVRDKPMELVDGSALLRLIEQLKSGPAAARSEPSILKAAAPESVATLQPTAPRCSSVVAERTNRATGQRFWGCEKFPACRGTIAIWYSGASVHPELHS
jgi:restriction system protein